LEDGGRGTREGRRDERLQWRQEDLDTLCDVSHVGEALQRRDRPGVRESVQGGEGKREESGVRKEKSLVHAYDRNKVARWDEYG
jgi:hypothetical protein